VRRSVKEVEFHIVGSISKTFSSNEKGMKASELPFKISIAKPCPARWEDMAGNERIRFCDHCCKSVYNISAMTTGEATALLEQKGENLCARVCQRNDGATVTRDCFPKAANRWQRARIFAASALTLLLVAIMNASGAARRNPSLSNPSRSRFLNAMASTTNKIQNCAMAGSCPTAFATTGAPRLMGRVAINPLYHPQITAPSNHMIWKMGDVVPTTQRVHSTATPAPEK